jgi:hypothetical protein
MSPHPEANIKTTPFLQGAETGNGHAFETKASHTAAFFTFYCVRFAIGVGIYAVLMHLHWREHRYGRRLAAGPAPLAAIE